jgi:hypothetical protein
MKAISALTIVAALSFGASHIAFAEQHARVTTETMATAQTMTRLPQYNSVISAWYKAAVYDPQENKVGEIEDLLVNADGSISAAMVSVGGFLGMGDKNVAVPMSALTWTKRDNKAWLTINATKDVLKQASAYKFDKRNERWEPANG